MFHMSNDSFLTFHRPHLALEYSGKVRKSHSVVLISSTILVKQFCVSDI